MPNDSLIHDIFHKDGNPSFHKNDFGRVLIIGGSPSFPFAPILAGKFANAAGVGYVGLTMPINVKEAAFSRAPLNTVFENLSKGDDSFSVSLLSDDINKYDSILFGNGVINNEENNRFLRSLLSIYRGNLILDAGALPIIASDNDILLKKNDASNILLTPHIGEAKKLFGVASTSRDPKDYEKELKEYSSRYQADVLLKGTMCSIIKYHNEENIKVLTNEAAPCLARGGSGDCLAGFISGLLGRKDLSNKYKELILAGNELFHEAARIAETKIKPSLVVFEDILNGFNDLDTNRI